MHTYIITSGAEKSEFKHIVKALDDHRCTYSWLPSLQAADKISKIDDLAFVVFNKSDHSSLSIDIDELLSKIPSKTHVFCIAETITPSDYKVVARTGRAELTDWASAPDDIYHYILLLDQHRKSDNAKEIVESSAPIVVAFLGTSGGPGNTTIALEVGVDLALRRHALGRKHGDVALLDLKSDSGNVCDYLNLSPKLAIKEIVDDPRRLDSYMLKMMASTHSSGLDVFCNISNEYNGNVSDLPAVIQILNCIVESYSTVLIDIPRGLTIDPSEILKNSDRVFVTGYFSVPSAKNVKTKLRYLDELGLNKDQGEVIITDTDTNLLGKISPRFNIASVFSERKVNYVRRDRIFALECSDAGVSMIQTEPNKGICQDIQKISLSIAEKLLI